MTRQACVIGLPRSGTTWVGKICDSSLDTLYLHEPDYSLRIPCVPFVAQVSDTEVWRPYIEQWLSSILRIGSRRTCAKRPRFAKSYLSSPADRFSERIWQAKLLAAAMVERLAGREYNVPLPWRLQRAPAVVWKSVESLGRLGVMASVLPDVRFVHVIRHPCGFVDSVMRCDREGHFQKSSPLSDDAGLFYWALTTQVAENFRLSLRQVMDLGPAERLAWFWLLMNKQAIADSKQLGNVAILLHDRIANDTLRETERLYSHLNLPFTESTRRFVTAPLENPSGHHYSVARSSKEASESWVDTMESEHARQVLNICGEFYNYLMVEYYRKVTKDGCEVGTPVPTA